MAIKAYPYGDSSKTSRFDKLIDGKWQPRSVIVNGVEIPPYIPSDDLISLVRLAQIIKRPILIKGDPGSGKTEFARSVAYEWYGKDYEKHYFRWDIKSTTKASEGLYFFDHISRLRDAQLSKGNYQVRTNKENKLKYRTFGPVGKAFKMTEDETKPPILLIDEIDKADIDFPNDLLLELDKYEFKIPETEEIIKAKIAPIIFITSNAERELPEAFLRRCLFCYIKFPGRIQLSNIIEAKYPSLFEKERAFVDQAVTRFETLRKSINDNPSENKQVSTSELLDWLKVYDFDRASTGIVKESLDTLPRYYQTLLKTYSILLRESKVTEEEEK
ncbi:AAA family ATPase [Dyadobacter sp. 32]|uniref:AAA family ATPase n=1 Tax=Dyadobacter sp. 32 TaxID=538966 RepID=UPI0011ED10E3